MTPLPDLYEVDITTSFPGRGDGATEKRIPVVTVPADQVGAVLDRLLEHVMTGAPGSVDITLRKLR